MTTELERTKRALETAQKGLQLLKFSDHRVAADMATTTLEDIEVILHPEPEYEEVEVVRWECSGCGHVTTYEQKICQGAVGDGWCNAKGPFFKLTGTLRRPKPQKVERSVSVANCVILSSGEIVIDNGPCPHNIYPFKDHRGLYGQRGTLTFTWTEEGEGK